MVDKYGEGAQSKPQPKNKLHVLKFRLTIGEADKARHIAKAKSFLEKRNQVKLMLQLRGREKSRPQAAVDFLNELLKELEGYGTPVNLPRHDNLTITVNPKKR